MVEGGAVWARAVLNVFVVATTPPRIIVAAIPRISMVLFVLYVIGRFDEVWVYYQFS